MHNNDLCDTDVWFGREDTPAPQSFVSNPAPELTVGVSIEYNGVSVAVRYRKAGMSWQRLEARKSMRLRDAQYYTIRFPRFPFGTRVEYEVLVRSSGLRSIPERRIGEICWFEVVSENINPSSDGTKETLPETTSSRVEANEVQASTKQGFAEAAISAPNIDRRAVVLDDSTGTARSGSLVIKQVDEPDNKGFAVFGTILGENGRPAVATTVRAYDKDMRSEQSLGEELSSSGHYRITYSEDQFSRAEKKTADLIVRAFDKEGNLRAASEIRFNAGESERIDLTFGPLSTMEGARLSELERLQDSIEPIREAVQYHLFTDDDLVFLTEETVRRGSLGELRRPTIRERLEFLCLAAQSEHDTGIPLAAFYGWFRRGLPQELDTLLETPANTLRLALEEAIEREIIPDISDLYEELFERIRAFEVESGRRQIHTFIGRLLHESNDQALSGYTVRAIQERDSELLTLGEDITERGFFSFDFQLPHHLDQNAPPPVAKLQFALLDPSGEDLLTFEVAATATQPEAKLIRVQVPPLDINPSTSVEDVLPPELARHLIDRGIRSLEDVRGRFSEGEQLQDLGVEQTRLIGAHANLEILTSDNSHRDALIESGFSSIVSIAGSNRSEFVAANHERLGDAIAARLHHQAVVQTAYAKNVLTQARVAGVISPQAMNAVTAKLPPPPCECQNCRSAVSPAAYLTELAEYGAQHLRNNGQPFGLGAMESTFHQPFAKLRLDCEAVEEEVRQVRICIEVLRSFLQLPAGGDDGGSDPAFIRAQRDYLHATYRDWLNRIGTSYEEVRQLPNAENEIRRAVAARIGIAEDHLDQLFFDLQADPSVFHEDDLEQLAGIRDTRRDPLSEAPAPLIEIWRLDYLRSLWEKSDWPSDPYTNGERPIIDPDLVTEADFRRLEAGQDAFEIWEARREEVAAFETSLLELDPRTNGIDPLLALVYKDGLVAADKMLLILQSGQDPQVVQSWLEEHQLTSAAFVHLMEIRNLADSAAEVQDSVLEEAVSILVQVQKIQRYEAWLSEEKDASIILGPNQFWQALEEPVLPAWRASGEDRQTWRLALQRNSKLSVITPYRIGPAELKTPEAGNAAFELWRQRRERADQRRQHFRTARLRAPDSLQVLEALFEASELNVGVADLVELSELKAQGHSIAGRLSQLGMDLAAFALLSRLHNLALKDASILESEWEEVVDILYGSEETLLYGQWRREEREAGILLSPDWFALVSSPPVEDLPSITSWLRQRQDYEAWRDLLQARRDQLRTVAEAVQGAASATEEATLTMLRDALIMATTQAQGNTLDDKATWLAERLLIDTQTSSCQFTTRVAIATSTYQLLLWGVRTGHVQDDFPNLVLDADYFDLEWKWIGSYAAWRSAMFVFLFPENILHPSLRPHQTPAYRQVISRLSSRVTPETACLAAQRYARYFRDISTLRPELSCKAVTRVSMGDPCRSSEFDNRDQVFMIAKSQESDRIYWSAYDIDSHDQDFAQSFWEGLEALDDYKILKLVGLVPMETADGTKKLYLFAKAGGQEREQLILVTYNLSAPDYGWDRSARTLELPKSLSEFDIVMDQKLEGGDVRFVLSAGGSQGYTRRFLPERDGWEGEIFLSVELHRGYKHLRAVAHDGGFMLIAETSDGLFMDSYTITGSGPDEKFVLNSDGETAEIGAAHQQGREWVGTVKIGYKTAATAERDVHYLFWRHQAQAYYSVAPLLGVPFSASSPRLINTNLTKIAIDASSAAKADDGRHIFIERSGAGKVYRAFLTSELPASEDISVPGATLKSAAPRVKEPRDIPAGLSSDELQIRRTLIANTLSYNEDSPLSNLVYFQEAYYFLPVLLALELQKGGHYVSALDWIRTVYDYAAVADKRKIYYGLVQEEDLSNSISSRPVGWLRDPLNPHRIASTRANTYTCYTLLALVRCLLDYGDAEFTRDTAESNERARTLYLTARELLEEGKLLPQNSECRELRLGLELIIVNPAWLPAFYDALEALESVYDHDRKTTLINKIQTTLNEGQLDERERLALVKQDIQSAVDAERTSQNLTETIDARSQSLAAMHGAVLAQPQLAQVSRQLAEAEGHAWTRSMSVVSDIEPGQLERESQGLDWLRRPILRVVEGVEPTVISPPQRVNPDSRGDIQSAFNIHPIEAANAINLTNMHFVPAAIDPSFCIPDNPVPRSLKLRAEANLFKLRNCLNIAGSLRRVEPYAAPVDAETGLPQIGSNGQLILPGIVNIPATPYRYSTLIERAKQLIGITQQIESAFLAALEKRDQAAFTRLQARQNVELSHAQVQLQQQRVDQARQGIKLAELQQGRARIQADTYQKWIEQGLNGWEEALLQGYENVRDAQISLAQLGYATQIAEAFLTATTADYKTVAAAMAAYAVYTSSAAFELQGRSRVIQAETQIQIAETQASFERREQDWKLQQKLAEQDVQIGNQQIALAESSLRIVGQEYEISQLQADHAQEILNFLDNQFTNVELYAWMIEILEGVYSYFLQQATALAKLAQDQLAFERQETPPSLIQSDYWNITIEGGGFNESSPDRRGLTGSARLLQDVYQLDQYAFETNQRKLQLSKTISLAQLAPVEFQALRESGIIRFDTPLKLFDQEFPGHYLRLIHQVRTSVIALFPPTSGIRATLSTTGMSKTVVTNGSGIFQQTTVVRPPDSVALSSPINASGLFELAPQQEMQRPFEGLGVETSWEFRLPKAANPFDFRTLADILITIDYTALDSSLYRDQVLEDLDNEMTGERSFSFRHDLADQWYDLNNPDQTGTAMTVRFETRRSDFPPNLTSVAIQHVVFYIVRKDGEAFEQEIQHLRFTLEGASGYVGGPSTTVESRVSTRSGNGTNWLPMIGLSPIGQWELAFPDDPPSDTQARDRFTNEQIENLLLVISFNGRLPNWPS